MLPVRYRARLGNAITHPVSARRVLAATLIGIGIAGCAHYAPEQTAVALESRSLSDPGLRFFIERSLGHALIDWPLKSWNLELLTLVAFYYSPELDVSRAQRGVADAAVVSAGTRPNPTLNITPEYATHVAS